MRPRGAAASGSGDIFTRLGARSLIIDEAVLASAEMHPGLDLFHSQPAPASVRTVLLRHVAVVAAPYYFGQNDMLCLEKGSSSSSPVLPSFIDHSDRLAWPVVNIGYVGRGILSDLCRLVLFVCVGVRVLFLCHV